MRLSQINSLFVGAVPLAAVFASAVASAAPPVVTVSVTASDTTGGTLRYRWKSTDGIIINANSPTTTWTLPNGPGLHFAYVLVSNGKGGYTERRVAMNTDTIGTPVVIPSPRNLVAPARTVPSGDIYRWLLNSQSYTYLNASRYA